MPRAGLAKLCAIRALRRWMHVANVRDGPLFRSVDRHEQISAPRVSAQSVSLIVKRCVTVIGLDPAGIPETPCR